MPVKYAHLFVQEESYPQNGFIFIGQLGEGATNVAQRVLHIRTNHVMVRKINDYIKAHVRDTKEAWDAINVAEFLFAQTIYGPPDAYGQRRVTDHSFFRYYNCGDLNGFLQRHGLDRGLPLFVIARFARQVLNALIFLYGNGIVHGDVHIRNIFVHLNPGSRLPDFYLGDLEYAKHVANWVCGDYAQPTDLPEVKLILEDIMPYRDDDRFPLCADIHSIIASLRAIHENHLSEQNVGVKLPDLADLLELQSFAEKAEQRCFQLPEEATTIRRFRPRPLHCPQPRYYDTREDILDSRSVIGPWYIARIESESGTFVDAEEGMHHRPNEANALENSDVPDGRNWNSKAGDTLANADAEDSATGSEESRVAAENQAQRSSSMESRDLDREDSDDSWVDMQSCKNP